MGCVSHKVSLGVEKGAREVESLFDVSADRSPLKGDPHLLSDGHEAMAEDWELDRVKRHIFWIFECLVTVLSLWGVRHTYDYVSEIVEVGQTTWLNKYGAGLIEDDTWSLNLHGAFEVA